MLFANSKTVKQNIFDRHPQLYTPVILGPVPRISLPLKKHLTKITGGVKWTQKQY